MISPRPHDCDHSFPTEKHGTLITTSHGLAVTAGPGVQPVSIDFGSNQHQWRRTRGSKNELLRRALNLKKMKSPLVLDATAGLGRDSFIMASLGCTVLMLERCATVAALLRDGLERGARQADIAPIIKRMRLQHGDFQTMSLQSNFDIIYLDPMFPERKKNALVKKELRLIRQLVGDDPDSDTLLARAIKLTPDRIIVKRPRLAPHLANQPPHHTIQGSKNRFDIYLPPWPNSLA